MAENDSIFEFGEKFGVESPFGNWLKPKESVGIEPRIEEVVVLRSPISGLIQNAKVLFPDPSKRRIVPLKIVVIVVNGYADKVEVEYYGRKVNAQYDYEKSTGDRMEYFTLQDVEIPVPFANHNFTFTAIISSLVTKKEVDRRSITVNIDENGKISQIGPSSKEKEEIVPEACGGKFSGLMRCIKYNGVYGPIYKGKTSLGSYAKLETLVTNGTLTSDQRDIIVAMSENEGNLEAIQSYDSEIATAGAMQKTINPEGYGEFPIQVWQFQQTHPKSVQSHLGNCGWKVVEEEQKDDKGKVLAVRYRIYYKEQTGKELKKLIRAGFSKANSGKKKDSNSLLPILKLLNDPDFQAKQLEDFIERMNTSLAKKPTGYTYLISEYLASNLGKATVLDHDVNRPGHVNRCFGKALDKFFEENKTAKKNPADWGTDHSDNETKLLEIYGPLRGDKESGFTMTDATGRYTKLKSKLE